MSSPALNCRTDQRRQTLRSTPNAPAAGGRWNGIDFVEFEPDTGNMELRVYFLCGVPSDLKANHLRLYSPVLRREVKVVGDPIRPHSANSVILTTETTLCDGAAYTLTIINRFDIDPRFARFEFTAHGETTEIDPKPAPNAASCRTTDPAINYLARDYASFRQLLLDRLALTVPGWTERHVPDLGMTLVELFAYVGDYLAYYQDAVASEAYLNTARQRVSVQRHARLVDYQLHEGCNARTFLHLNVVGAGRVLLDPVDVYFITEHPDPKFKQQPVLAPQDLEHLPPHSVEPFEVVRWQPRCRHLECDDIKNVVGLMGALVLYSDEHHHSTLRDFIQNDLAKFIWNQLPGLLKREIQDYLVSAESLPPRELTERLVMALNSLMQQYCLSHQIRTIGPADDDTRFRLNGQLNDPTRTVDNIRILKNAFSAFFSRLDDSQIELDPGHNTLRFYTWNQSECHLPIGTTHATVCDDPECDPYSGTPTPLLPHAVPYNEADAILPTEVDPSATTLPVKKHPLLSRYVLAHLDNWNLRHLSPGDILIFEEQYGPRTHNKSDADPTHRQAVRLTRVNFSIDPVAKVRVVEIDWEHADALKFPLCISSIGPVEDGCLLKADISVAHGNVLLIDHGVTLAPEWIREPIPHSEPKVCGASYLNQKTQTQPSRSELFRPKLKEAGLTFAAPVTACSAASMLLQQKPHEALPALQVSGFPTATEPTDAFRDADVPPPTIATFDDVEQPLRLFQRLNQLDDLELRRLKSILPAHASRLLQQYLLKDDGEQLRGSIDSKIRSQGQNFHGPLGRFQAAVSPPAIASTSPAHSAEISRFSAAFRAAVRWDPKQHLLDSDSESQGVVVEVDNERRTRLRFGDDDLGRRPTAGTSFYATYRIGNGTNGNVGADKIKHVVFRRTRPAGIVSVRNPLAAEGGQEPESVDHARMHAPHQYKKLRRAITADDYAEIALREFPGEIQQARAMLHWMGMSYEVSVAIDPLATVTYAPGLIQRVKQTLERYRRIGHLLHVSLPTYVGVDIAMSVCVESSYLTAHVRQELLDLFSSRILSDGTRGFFHTDNFGFGDELYLSQVIATAKTIRGVENVDITRFQKLHQGDQGEIENGVMTFGPLEIPRLDNDPLRPENGRFCLDMRGTR